MILHSLVSPCLMLTAAACLVLLPAAAMPYRSTQGVLHTRPSLNDFLTTYLQAAQQRAEPQYGYPEYQPPYQPSYQQGYLAQRPRRVQWQQNYEPLIHYLNSPDVQQDYPSYDLAGSDQMYTDPDGTWYDDNTVPAGAVIGSPSYVPQASATDVTSDFLSSEPTEQDLALAQLMLDHIAGKYSLEDLETLEREARLEENTENQLRALTKKVLPKKAMMMPYLGRSIPSHSSLKHGTPNSGFNKPVVSRVTSVSRATPEGLITMTQRRGQKEEPVVVPATSVRRPVFAQHLEESAPLITVENRNAVPQAINKKSVSVTASKDVTSTSSSQATSAADKTSGAQVASILKSASSSPVFTSSSSSKASRPRTSGVVEVVKVEDDPLPPSPRGSAASATDGSSGSPVKTDREVQSAYEALKHYLDTEREARMLDDQELLRSPQKRFVKDDDPLQRELYNLKKTVA